MKNKLIMYYVSLMLFISSTAMASGIGFYGSFGGGTNSWDHSKINTNLYNGGGGLLFDTNVAGNKLLNYRLELDFRFRVEYPRPANSYFKPNDLTSDHLGTIHTLAFGLIRTDLIRFWLGPQVAIGGTRYLMAASGTGISFLTEKNSWGMWGGLGAALGVNINIGDVFTLSLSSSVRADGNFNYHFSGYRIDALYWAVSPQLAAVQAIYGKSNYNKGIGVNGQINVAFIFRINDKY
jgi:hypothetical protein